MKSLAKISLLLCSFALIFASCDCDCSKKTGSSLVDPNKPITVDPNAPNRGAQIEFKKQIALELKSKMSNVASVAKLKYDASMLGGKSLAQLETLFKKDQSAADAKDDARLIASIFTAFMAAENKASALDIQFSMTPEPIEGGFVIFAINAETERTLTFQMFRESDFELVASNTMSLHKGANYKAINVKDFPDGVYLIKISDNSNQAEMVQRAEIGNNVNM